MPSVAATSPPVLIAHLAAQTSQLRLGSGGVMLPNHAPLAVAEQFALLEAAAPGPHRPGHRPGARLRPGDVDGVARPGAAATTRHREVPGVPRRRGRDDERQRRAGARIPQQDYILKATPAAVSEPRHVAAGLVDVLRASGRGQGAAVRVRPSLLRAGHRRGAGRSTGREFVPSDLAAEPVTFLTVNAVVAETHDEAMALMLPNLQMMARLRTGQPLGRSISSRTPNRQRADARRSSAVVEAGCGEPSSATRPRPPNRCGRWPTSSTSTR